MKKYLLSVCLLFGVIVSFLMAPVNANAADINYETIKVTNLNSLLEYDRDVNLSWSHRWDLARGAVEEDAVYGKFTLTNESYVRIKCSLDSETQKSFESQNKFLLYANASMANPIVENDIGYGKGDDWIKLSAGTYYAKMTGKLYTYPEARYTTNVCIGAMPVKGAVTIKMEPVNKYKKVRVTVTQKLSKDARISYRQGKETSFYTATKLEPGEMSFVVDANGTYSVRVLAPSTVAFNKELEVISYPKVKLIDTKSPTVTGVKNKKVYKKTVTIKFKDAGSGIKSAKLNGKTIKSGKKVKKVGKYKLVVTDKAGNKTTISFRIAKK